jgi:uncharacterized protein YndB with AHSA1/START domain
MKTDEFSRIDKSIEINTPPERVWHALTDAASLSAWFQVEIEGEIAVGNQVWMTTTQPDMPPQRFAVYFVEMIPTRRLVWQWYPGSVDPAVDYAREPRTTVTFTLEASPLGTLLHVAETGFDQISLERRAKVYGDNSHGWPVVLVWLKQHVEKPA